MDNVRSPESWMCAETEGASREAAAKESIREWYDRTTRRMRRALIWASVCAAICGTLLWLLASFGTLAKIQTFQGAFSIPCVGGIWLLSFVFIFLIPSREVSFRSQEAIERTVELLESAIEGRIGPAVALWKRIGERVERELPAFIEEARATFAGARAVIEKLEKASEQNGRMAEEAKPVIDALRRIEEKVEREGLIDELLEAARAVRALGGAPPAPAEMPRLDFAIAALGGRKVGTRP